MHRIKLLLLAIVAMAAITAGTANATTIRASPGGAYTSVSLGRVTFTGGVITIRCNLTLRGTLATSATASAGTRIGDMSRVEVAGCEGGTVRSINNLPYSLTFERLTETGLEFRVNRANFTLSVTIFGIVVDCTYEGNVPALVEIISGRTGLIRILTNSLSKTAGSGSCPASGSMTGTFGLSPQQTITLS
jgi:hypothetical protein